MRPSPPRSETIAVLDEVVEYKRRVPRDDLLTSPKEVVLIALHSANRDGDLFHNADNFDVTRATRKHLAFGHGIHHGVGAPLARVEGVIAFRQLLGRCKHIRLDRAEPLRYHDNSIILGLVRSPVWFREGGNG